MKVQFINAEKKTWEDLQQALNKVMYETMNKLQQDKGVEVEAMVAVDAEFTIGVKLAGMEEPQFLTVEHHKDVPEMFKWVIDLETDELENNEQASYFDSWSVAKYKGEEHQFETIETAYDTNDLYLESLEEFGNMEKRTLLHNDGYKVVRNYQDERLVQEYKLIPSADKTE